jgi:uncharacterized oligopeptide transporter (OPT) family protein
MNRLLGDQPLSTIFRLIVLSVVVGIVLTWAGLSPFALLDNLRVTLLHIYHMGFSAFDWLIQYFLLGAVIVVPIWLISRLWRSVNGRNSSKS